MDPSAVDNNNPPIFKLIRERQGIAEKIPDDEQKAGERVLEKARKVQSEKWGNAFSVLWTSNPKALELETPPTKYLRQTRSDESLAATNLANYWELRRQHFGPNKYLRPLLAANTDKGALSQQDVKVLESGFLLVLPYDTNGCPVVCYDRSRLENDFSVEDLDKLVPNVRRCLCYVLSIIAEDPISQEDGITFLEIYHSSLTNQPFDVAFHESLKEWIAVVPISTMRMEVVVRPPRRESASFLNETIPKLRSIIAENHKGEMHFTIQSFTEKLLTEVEKRGFNSKGIPSTIGGGWVFYKRFLDWRRERGITEGLIEAYLTEDKTAATAMVTKVFRKEAHRKRKREQDLEYARRKREHSRETVQQLEAQIVHLRTNASHLTEENTRLTNLLTMARERVRRIDHLQQQQQQTHTAVNSSGLASMLHSASVPSVTPALAAGIDLAWRQPFLASSMLQGATAPPCLDPRTLPVPTVAHAPAPLSLNNILGSTPVYQASSAAAPLGSGLSNTADLLGLSLALAQRRDVGRRLQAAMLSQPSASSALHFSQISSATQEPNPDMQRFLQDLLRRQQSNGGQSYPPQSKEWQRRNNFP